jgi:hypothetical protein
VIVGVKATGIGDTSTASDDSGTPATFRLPKPSDTESSIPDPQETLEPSAGESTSESAATGIMLTAAQESVSPMQQIDLTGTYPGGDGAILQLQRFENEQWTDFPVTMSVTGGAFATYVLTARTGENRFRVVDTDSDVMSDEVTVTVG